ncbi:MAG: dehypoxanthine futalosine cyclase [Armatimonadetes bacterium]|nr:dehypoxanthine futalosine cyclase [Armatimonadota bacterium]
MQGIEDIAEKVLTGERIAYDDGMRLFRHSNLTDLAVLADFVRRRKHPELIVTYVIGRNINYTNICWVRCKFCAFYRIPGHAEGYVLPHEAIFRKIEELVAVGGTEVLMQGGVNPRLKIEYFEDLLRQIKARYRVHMHSLSVAEVMHIARLSKLGIEETLRRLHAAGLDSLPGAGGEILDDEVRRQIAPYKDTTEEWLGVMCAAQRIGMPTTATMMYGSVERPDHRMNHLQRVRDLQDETGGFTAFIAWSFQPDDTELGGSRASAFDYLRTTAVSRIFLDNIDNMQASWVTQGPKIAQVALGYGLNDYGSTMMEENVVSAAGTQFVMSIEEMERQIRTAGYIPKRRDTYYRLVNTGASG